MVLKQPVLPFLTNTILTEHPEKTGIWDRPQRVSPKKYHFALDSASYMAKKIIAKVWHFRLIFI